MLEAMAHEPGAFGESGEEALLEVFQPCEELPAVVQHALHKIHDLGLEVGERLFNAFVDTPTDGAADFVLWRLLPRSSLEAQSRSPSAGFPNRQAHPGDASASHQPQPALRLPCPLETWVRSFRRNVAQLRTACICQLLGCLQNLLLHALEVTDLLKCFIFALFL